jgi:hypothetical protein
MTLYFRNQEFADVANELATLKKLPIVEAVYEALINELRRLLQETKEPAKIKAIRKALRVSKSPAAEFRDFRVCRLP